MSGWVWEFGFWGDFHAWFLSSFWASRELVGWLLGKGGFGNLWSFLSYFQFAFKYMYLWSFDGVSFLDESTMYDISFQTHELQTPEISRLIDQLIDGNTRQSIKGAVLGLYFVPIHSC